MARTRSLERIEEAIAGVEEGSIRHRVLSNAKLFKTSWIDLGQALYAVWKDKLYREWDYQKFDAYVAKEIGIRKETALKLLKSYYYLEREEPRLLDKSFVEEKDTATVPSIDAVNVLRLAEHKKLLDRSDYAAMKRTVLDYGKDAREVKKDLTALIREREELEPDEAREKKRISSLRRFLGTLKSLQREIAASKMLSAAITKEIASLIAKIESEVVS